MKSAHRHELQTNALAHRLDVAINRTRPYVSTILGVIVAIAVLAFIWSYISGASEATRGDAWNQFNQAVGSAPPNLEALHQSAQEFPGTKMQQLADVTWADGQVLLASESYLHNKRASRDALDRAASAYQSVIQTSSDKRLVNRAQLGLARIYEMRGDLPKAEEAYLKVGGGYADFAKEQAERLKKPESKEIYAWLEKAEPPRTAAPLGPGVPGERPEFSAGDLSLPEGGTEQAVPTAPASGNEFDELIKGLGTLPSSTSGADEGTPPDSTETNPLTTPLTPADPAGAAPSDTPTGTLEPAPADSATPAPPEATPPAEETSDSEQK